MHVLLTGSTGFIVLHTAVELTATGHSAVSTDNLANSSASVVDLYQVDMADAA